MNILKLFIIPILFILTLSACNKTSTYPYSVRLTDGPGPYSAVNIDLIGVEVKNSDSTTVLLNVKSGIYNLLNFANGMDTIIASADLSSPSISQIRLILGSNNAVVLNNVSYPLSTPSADQSGLKIQVHQTLTAGAENQILLDFDADKSVVETGNGSFKLKPVIRTIEIDITGSIKGKISLVGTLAIVSAISSSNVSYSSYVSSKGEFKISGIPPGVYSVVVTPPLPLSPVTTVNVNVTTGITSDIGTIIL